MDTVKERLRPIFLADWVDVVFMHFEVDALLLRKHVPVELDLWEERAYVSLVAFTQKRLRPAWGGRIAQWLTAPVGEHEFLNLRTYVRVGQERGIYFLIEWIPNALARLIGPAMYGLPYRLGGIRYEVDEQRSSLQGMVEAQGRLKFHATVDEEQMVTAAPPGSLEEFLLERYTAFTCRKGALRRFRIRHEPWPQVEARCELPEKSLLHGLRWLDHAPLVKANYSAGVRDVRIGGPQRFTAAHRASNAVRALQRWPGP